MLSRSKQRLSLTAGSHYIHTLPMAPILPRSAKECQSFSADVDAYATAHAKDHEDCLARTNQTDRMFRQTIRGRRRSQSFVSALSTRPAVGRISGLYRPVVGAKRRLSFVSFWKSWQDRRYLGRWPETGMWEVS
jgi:hypothetical protein